MKRIALTGGTGFVGANLVRRLLRDGHVVHLLVRPKHAAWRIEEIRSDVRLHVLDLLDAQAVSKTIEEIKPEWIFHLAAHGAYSWQADVAQIFKTNIIGTLHLVEACLKTGFESFINTGSSSEYGFKDHAPGETEGLEPNSHYAVAKASATLYCRYTAQARKVNITTLRLYSAYGPYEEPNRLMPTLIRHGLRGEWPPLVNPDTARDYVYVEDVCDACILAAQTAPREFGAVFNLGTGKQTTLSEVVSIVRRVLGIEAEPQWGTMPARIWDTSIWRADSRKIQAELDWRPRHSFQAGFSRMVEWQRNRQGQK
ncbi:MAG: NAD-dependent epimerase/dehydratase family protein [Verrucomicrobia bacterium]|nr:NAD-dependent epimerase/dehydratase family protein [Verrucomicrobiota bacterium]